MKIYTKKGDDGTTSLFGGQRVDKDHIRIEAYGTIDELNAFLGHLADQISVEHQTFLHRVQNELFCVGAMLATSQERKPPVYLAEDVIQFVEVAIDQLEETLPPLKQFILPVGHRVISLAHICRTVCRRAERRVASLSKSASVDPIVLVFLNRLSDYLFVLARKLGQDLEVTEIGWKQE